MTRVKRLLRGVAYLVLPGELVLLVCLMAGLRPPAPVLAAAEAAVLFLLLAEAAVFLRLWRGEGLTPREAVRELVPEPVLRLAGHELRLMWSLLLWAARRRSGVGPGDRVFGHARDQAALLFGFGFVCVVEAVGMAYLLSPWPVLHAVVLVLDVYTVLFVVGLHAASVTRPHTLSGDTLRLRQAAHVDVRIPLERIASASYELVFTHDKKEEGVLNLPVGAQTSLTLTLSDPVESVGLLGRTRQVHTVRCHADDARDLLRAVTRARTALAPPPGRPA
ncbi:hypothetical protein [Streptomyces marianii]|uniref:Uncharacterized protein n=1 Tax=Streptomyces marianii TaxID=1817406 RepID=A0A5R9EE22_9ACTN|nr:hypothetical protein [Streptomyces marianii]TLQ46294.1 hypothetical protein FEF34_27900 [Streptomyces marianii]